MNLTFKQLAEKILGDLTEEELDQPAEIYIPPYMPENYFELESVIVPMDGEKRGSPFLIIGTKENQNTLDLSTESTPHVRPTQTRFVILHHGECVQLLW
jgi:hypothetical protein